MPPPPLSEVAGTERHQQKHHSRSESGAALDTRSAKLHRLFNCLAEFESPKLQERVVYHRPDADAFERVRKTPPCRHHRIRVDGSAQCIVPTCLPQLQEEFAAAASIIAAASAANAVKSKSGKRTRRARDRGGTRTAATTSAAAPSGPITRSDANADDLQFSSNFECANLKSASTTTSNFNGYHVDPGDKYGHFGTAARCVDAEYHLRVRRFCVLKISQWPDSTCPRVIVRPVLHCCPCLCPSSTKTPTLQALRSGSTSLCADQRMVSRNRGPCGSS